MLIESDLVLSYKLSSVLEKSLGVHAQLAGCRGQDESPWNAFTMTRGRTHVCVCIPSHSRTPSTAHTC